MSFDLVHLVIVVSIHAPRVGRDCKDKCVWSPLQGFNSRTPCGARPTKRQATTRSSVFQFTHPVWGATRMYSSTSTSRWCFNSRTPCGARQPEASQWRRSKRFNSRTPCGARHGEVLAEWQGYRFQFTHPVWGATSSPSVRGRISASFNSRTPCGARLTVDAHQGCEPAVSIHAPRVGRDCA